MKKWPSSGRNRSAQAEIKKNKHTNPPESCSSLFLLDVFSHVNAHQSVVRIYLLVKKNILSDLFIVFTDFIHYL